MRLGPVTARLLLLITGSRIGSSFIVRGVPPLRSTSFAAAAAASSSATTVRNQPPSAGRSCIAAKMSTASTAASTAAAATTLEESSDSYRELLTKLQTVTQLRRASAVLNYDQMVFMPHADRASVERGKQMSALAELIHEKATDPKLKDLLAKSENDLDSASASATDADEARRILELERRSYEKNERVPPELEAKRAALSSSAYAAWVKARKANDFPSFEPVLRDCFETAMEVAEKQRGDDNEDKTLYTQMLDEYEMGMDATRIDDLFVEVEKALVPLIANVLASTEGPSTDALRGKFPLSAQEKVNRDIVTKLGYDAEHGRIDVSVHPFTTSFSSADVRITSRFSEDEWYQGLAGTVHEGGHAMYEQNLGDSGLDVDSALSMGMHESQSLFWERHVGLSKSYWRWAAPMLKEAFGDGFNYTPEELYGAVNHVKPGLIRVEADELTYPLHVILRYNIERDVVEGRLDVKDIPSRWKEGMKSYLGVAVPDDAQGCLQDIHWSGLAIGYFPTYLLGSMAAAQLAHYCRKDIPDMDDRIERGEFADIKAWLTDKVHRHGRRYKSLDALLEAELGERLNPKYFIDYLSEKYTELYKC